MRHSSKFLGLSMAVATVASFTACSSGTGSPGSEDAGHVLGTGGAAANVGGDSSAGGSTSAVTGGSTSVADTSTVTTGGSTAVSSTAKPFIVNSFDSSEQVGVFKPSTFLPTDCSVNVNIANDAGRTLQVEWSGSVDTNADATTPGSMKITSTFTNWNQYWEVDMLAPTDSNGDPIDLTNKLITAQIKVKSGLSPVASYPYGGILFVKTGSDYVWGASKWTNLESTAGFITLTLDATSPQGVPDGKTWLPKEAVELGIKLGTGGAGESTYCGGDYGAAFGPPQETIAYVDAVKISDRP